jgi:Bacterial Ig domain
MIRKISYLLFLIVFLATSAVARPASGSIDSAQGNGSPARFESLLDQALWYQDQEIEHTWKPDYLSVATGDPHLPADHGVYAWPFALDSIGWSMQSYQDYGGTPYFHHGMDMMKIYGTDVFNQSGGQVINIENYGYSELYWEVAVLDPYGYIWQYHHINQTTIPQYIWDKFAEYQADPVNGGFIPAFTYIGDIIEWPVWSFGKQFNHIHLNILAAGGVYVNGFEFHNPLPDTVGPEIQGVGLLRNGQIYPGNAIEGNYSLYVHARDLILDDVFYLPPWEITFSVDGESVQTTWRFDTLPGGADDTAYLSDFYVVPPTCGNYDCRDYYIDLGFIPDSQFVFPWISGEHTVLVTVSDYAGNAASQTFTYTVSGTPSGTPVWQDDFGADQGWIPNPGGTDTATSGLWERGDPEDTYSGGAKQLGSTPTGLDDLVTGRLAGGSATSYDVDGGVTSTRSPDIALPADTALTLSFQYYLAHGSNSSSADYLRVSVVSTNTLTVFEELGAANNDNGAWAIENVDISSFSGQTVYLLFEAADNSAESLVEAAIDNLVILATGINHAPVADSQSISTPEDTPLGIFLTGSDPEGDPLTFTVVSTPTHGSLSGTVPDLTYTPTSNYNGADSFTFLASDGQVSSEPATVSIAVTAVNDAPAADSQSISTPEDTPLDILLTGSDLDGDPLTFTLVSTPTHGALSGTAPDLMYIPAANYNGADSFTFLASDGQVNSELAAVSVTVTAVNDAPAANPQSVSTTKGRPANIVLTGSDPDGDPLTFTIISNPTHGTLSGAGPNLIYTPAPGYVGLDSFSFVVNDGEVDSGVAVVRILVNQAVYVPMIIK